MFPSVSKMPLNKFNQHYLDSQPSLLNESVATQPLESSFYLCKPVTYHSKCVLTIRGRKDLSLSKTCYTLDNQKTTYTFPISGKITNIECYPISLRLYYNTSNNTKNLLVDKIITKGDTIEFPYNLMGQIVDNIYVEFTVESPIEKDE